jgi:hypothetical protein
MVRRFLGCIFILTILVVAGAFLFFMFGQQLIIKQAAPKGHFEQPAPDSGPDYAKAESWVAKPGMDANPTMWVPEGEVLALAPTRASLFYVHPTTYLERDHWNALIAAGEPTDGRTTLFTRSQASAFNQVASIWAPRYRQAAFGAFLLQNEDAQKAMDVAYGDVLRAFDAFVNEAPPGQPIIVAGHSQGSLHALRLLKDRREALKGRLVAAYIGGWPVGRTSDLPATGLSACNTAEQTGCVLSWQSFAEPANTKSVIDAWTATKGLTGADHRRTDMICTNPLTGGGGAAGPNANPGTLVPEADLSGASLRQGLVGARCDQGFLMINGEIPSMGPFVLPGNNYHVYDYALFWGAIRADAARRMEAWGKP